MISTHTLRYRLLALVTGSGLAAACGGNVEEGGGGSITGGNAGSGASATGGDAGNGNGGSGGGGSGGIAGTGGTIGGAGGCVGYGGYGSGAVGGYGHAGSPSGVGGCAGYAGVGGYGTGGYGAGGYGATGGYGAGGYGATGGYGGTGGYGTGGYGTGGVGGGTGGTGGFVNCGCPSPPWETCFTEDQARAMLKPGEPLPPSGVCPDYQSLLHPQSCSYFSGGRGRVDSDCCYYTVDTGSCIGRPFIVDGELRRADVMRRRDWSARLTQAESEYLDTLMRRALSESWLEDARLEHASVASFARLTLELLALGAPPDLVALSQSASLDEIEHARRCFALASRYAGQPLGPSALRIEGATCDRTTLVDVAVATIREGCVGETIASLIAAAELAVARDHDVRSTLELISEDEARHAELAWRIVGWALEVGGARVHGAVRAAVDALFAEDDPLAETTWRRHDDDWHAHGRLTPAELCAVRKRAIQEVIRPCAEALLCRSAGVAEPSEPRHPVAQAS